MKAETKIDRATTFRGLSLFLFPTRGLPLSKRIDEA